MYRVALYSLVYHVITKYYYITAKEFDVSHHITIR